MATVTAVRPRQEAVTIGEAADAFLVPIARPETSGTHQQYKAALQRFRTAFGDGTDLAGLDAKPVAARTSRGLAPPPG
jgi:hypothetical protein